MTAPTTDFLLTLAEDLQRLTKAMRPGNYGTKEEWDAWVCMDEAARRVFSAAAWTARAQEKRSK